MFKNTSSTVSGENVDPSLAGKAGGGGLAKAAMDKLKPALAKAGSNRFALGDISNRQKQTSEGVSWTSSASSTTASSTTSTSTSTSSSATSETLGVMKDARKSDAADLASLDAELDVDTLTSSSSSASTSTASTSTSSTSTTAASTDSRPTSMGVMKEQRKLEADLIVTGGSSDTEGAEEAMDTSMSSVEVGSDFTIAEVDVPDKTNPQMVTDYIQDIVAYFRKTEARRAPSPTYMTKQTDINAKMREILIDWLVEVHLKFKLCLETLYLTVNIIDRFLERRAVKRTKLQLVGCTAMLIASKYEEIYPPEVKDFVYISDKAYNHEQILAMESIMLNTLKFNLTVPSALRFAERYVKVSGGNKLLLWTTEYLLELTLQKYHFLKYLPSMLAASALYLAQKMTNQGTWNSTIVSHTQYSEQAIEPCVRDLIALATQKTPRYCAVRKKFTNPKFMSVAKLTVWNPEGTTPAATSATAATTLGATS